MNIDSHVLDYLSRLESCLSDSGDFQPETLSQFPLEVDQFTANILYLQIVSLQKGSSISSSVELDLSSHLLASLSDYTLLCNFEVLLNGIGLCRAAYCLHLKHSSFSYWYCRPPSLNIFYVFRFLSLSFLAKPFFCIYLQTQKWTSSCFALLSLFARLRAISPFLQSRHYLSSLFHSSSVGIFCPGPSFSFDQSIQSSAEIIILFNYIPSSRELSCCHRLKKKIVIVLAQRKVKILSPADIVSLDSSSIASILLKTDSDFSKLSSLISDSSKLHYTPRLTLSVAELNVAIDMLAFVFSCAPKKIFFENATMYTDVGGSFYPQGYHRSSVHSCQFAWHSPYIQFCFIRFFRNIDCVFYDSYLDALSRNSVKKYLSLL